MRAHEVDLITLIQGTKQFRCRSTSGCTRGRRNSWNRSRARSASATLRLVEITAEPGDNVHRIFQSLNNTGLSLTQADLLRNFLFMLMPTQAENVYQDVWLDMQDRLGNEGLKTLRGCRDLRGTWVAVPDLRSAWW